jgi:hypothetical protein
LQTHSGMRLKSDFNGKVLQQTYQLFRQQYDVMKTQHKVGEGTSFEERLALQQRDSPPTCKRPLTEQQCLASAFNVRCFLWQSALAYERTLMPSLSVQPSCRQPQLCRNQAHPQLVPWLHQLPRGPVYPATYSSRARWGSTGRSGEHTLP